MDIDYTDSVPEEEIPYEIVTGENEEPVNVWVQLWTDFSEEFSLERLGIVVGLFLVGLLTISPRRSVNRLRPLLVFMRRLRRKFSKSAKHETIQVNPGSPHSPKNVRDCIGIEETTASPVTVCTGVVLPTEEEATAEAVFEKMWPSIRLSRYRRLVLPPECRLLEKVAMQRARAAQKKQQQKRTKKPKKAEYGVDHPITRLKYYAMQFFYLLQSLWSLDYANVGRTLIAWFTYCLKKRGTEVDALEEEEEEDDVSINSKASNNSSQSQLRIPVLGPTTAEEKKDDIPSLVRPFRLLRSRSSGTGHYQSSSDVMCDPASPEYVIPPPTKPRLPPGRTSGKRKDALEAYRSPSVAFNSTISPTPSKTTISNSSPRPKTAFDVDGTDCGATSTVTTLSPRSSQVSLGPDTLSFFEAAPSEESLNRLRVEVPVPDLNGYTLGDAFLPSKKHTPLLVFVNSRSGPQQGQLLISQLRRLLNPIQVWDLADGGPEKVLESFAVFTRLRIMVCGGDGTVAWIISAIDKMQLERWPPIAILPMGTGNDLARIHGWGGGYNNESLISILEDVADSYTSLLDRWEVKIESRKGRVKEKSFFNYLGVGVDAQAALQFHMLRESSPYLFFSRAVNKAWYALFGAEEAVKASHANLPNEIRLIADGVEVPLPPHTQGILLLNIDSYAGGVTMWSRATKLPERLSRDDRQSSVDALPQVGWGRSASPRRVKSMDTLSTLGATSRSEIRYPMVREESADDLTLPSMPSSDDDKLGRVTASSLPSSCQDGMLDVVAFRGTVHLGQIRVGLSTANRICQCREVEIIIKKKVAVQIDGEPWRQSTSTLRITRKKEPALMLHRSPDETGGAEKEMAKLIDWGEEHGLFDRNVHATLMKEYSRRIETMTRRRREQSQDNLVLSLKRAMINQAHHNSNFQGGLAF